MQSIFHLFAPNNLTLFHETCDCALSLSSSTETYWKKTVDELKTADLMFEKLR